ncbi:hypothetical protein BKA70DRAFT_1146507 [Coprinopsis sp. MPI-PUGE-AT-0042]|nr:hypothetical protein BKA70DRAFT_1146507 [Coprinopsis sp. MPI-PUGE-AT-0042]
MFSPIHSRFQARKSQTKAVQGVFSAAPIYDNILSLVDPGDAIRLGKTCRSATQAYHNFISRAYNIDKLYRRWFKDTTGFRRLQAKTGTLVSGSTAVQYFDRTFYESSDIDIYTFRKEAVEVAEWIVGEGYVYQAIGAFPDYESHIEQLKNECSDEEWPPEETYVNGGMCTVMEFKKNGAVVQLIVTRNCPFHAITMFHSTCVMNFISYEAAYSMYAAATFDARVATVNGDKLTDKELRAIMKYQNRGWTFTTNLRLHGPRAMQLFHFDETRWVGDRHVWRLPLKTLDTPDRIFTSTSEPMTVDPAIANSWRWQKDEDCIELAGYIASKLLRYRYTFGDAELGREVITFLRKQGKFEFRKQRVMGVSESDAPDSDNWTYWDGVLYQLYYQHFERRRTAEAYRRRLRI